METITYLNIAVSGFPFLKIRELDIWHEPNQHAKARVVGEADPETAKDCMQRMDEGSLVEITTTAQGQPPMLFCGCVSGTSLQQDNAYSLVCLNLLSTSRLTDIIKKKRTYQNTAMTYEQMININMSEKADLHMMVSDKAIGALVMQFGETDWEFAKRMASHLEAPVIANVSSVRPQVYIGLPDSSRTISEDSLFYDYGNDADQHAQNAGAMAQDFSSQTVCSYSYGYVGDTLAFNGKACRIKSVSAQLKDGIMQMTYGLLEGGGASAGSVQGIAVPQTANAQASGKMMKGEVKAVERDKVQVFLNSVDESYDSGGNWWFPYSTAYSSSDGSGWYCMPEVGDEVLVFFPSGNEGEAFAASSVNVSPPDNPRNKSWKAPGGKEILLTDEGMFIISKSGKIFINLTDENGIEIHADKDINISSEANIYINSADTIGVVAKNQVMVGTEGAYLELTQGSAVLAASEVYIN